MAHGVHPAVKGVEAAGVDSPPDRTRSQTGGEKSLTAHDSVLPPGEHTDDRSGSKVVAFVPHSGINVTNLTHASDGADPNATELTPSVPKFAQSLDRRRYLTHPLINQWIN